MLKTVIQSLKSCYNLSTQEIAERAKISKRTVSRILSGELDNPKMTTLIGLSECFGVPLDSLCEQRVDRVIRAEEFTDIMIFRSLSPEYQKKCTEYLHQVAHEWHEALLSSYNLSARKAFHERIDRLPLTELQEIEKILKEKRPNLFELKTGGK